MNARLKTLAVFIMACCAIPALGGAIHTWAQGATLASSDLNANFTHIHNLMVGGHGGRLVDADVNGSANIASSKLASYRYFPRAWGDVAACTSATCTLIASESVSSVTRSATGLYAVTLNYTPTNGNYGVIVTRTVGAVVGTGSGYCIVEPTRATTFNVDCFRNTTDGTAGAAQDVGFSFIIMDND
jgi:hypothetical protein